MSTSTPAKNTDTGQPPSPAESPLADSGFSSRGLVHLTGLTFHEDPDVTVVTFKGANDDQGADEDTTVAEMGDVAELQKQNAALQQRLAALEGLQDVVADLWQQITDTRKDVGNLSATGASPQMWANCARSHPS